MVSQKKFLFLSRRRNIRLFIEDLLLHSKLKTKLSVVSHQSRDHSKNSGDLDENDYKSKFLCMF